MKQTVADMKTELNKVIQRIRRGPEQLLTRLDAENQKYAAGSRRNGKIAPGCSLAGNEDLARESTGQGNSECD